ncbi:hypothetical protein M430DRAFT_36902 [Amorphotheca resinae ATCC 22711]|uniref:Uncharacterized protein n=1 Tax=Amorphotheca resinae ATCC 22711 TaxID=857342 RepID=A0A2T3AT29_AMORE|nr:hypothetical protein M430DRAFT_36902 [Amorphotheca resinae ATCC 22711]PSS10636.1 hypothetical protein M430DRAFT_36902 [Amorphotheca resinae ATCC 22711]
MENYDVPSPPGTQVRISTYRKEHPSHDPIPCYPIPSHPIIMHPNILPPSIILTSSHAAAYKQS